MARRGPQPTKWITGPDPVTHAQYRAWLQQRNQAQWRNELWQLPFDQWQAVWGTQWPQRGRAQTDLMMTRQDWSLPWTQANAEIITRKQHGQRQGQLRAQGYKSLARRRELSAENRLTK